MSKQCAWLSLYALCVCAGRVVEVRAQGHTDGATTQNASDTRQTQASPASDNPGEKNVEAVDPQPDDRAIQPGEVPGEVIELKAEAPYIPVSSRAVRDRDFRLRPRPRPADILRVVPGMFVNQHAGGGKANQYFLRGFDADHGTDIALSFDGIPANMVSHAHGQGYADLNWVIPEVVESVDTFKGPYAARLGDFATAGAIDMKARNRAEPSSIGLTGGLFDTYRALALFHGDEFLDWQPMAAVELYRSNGPFESGENNRRYSIYAHIHRTLGPSSTLKLAATSYMGAWNSSGQIPQREVTAGRLGQFGAIDPTDGGASQRHSTYARLDARPSNNSEFSLLVYLVRYQLNLFSNFTFFAADPISGDQIEQEDDRWYAGLSSSLRFKNRLSGIPLVTTFGIQARGDDASTGLFTARARERLMTGVDADVRQNSLGVFMQEDVAWHRQFRTVIGLRMGYFDFQVDDRLNSTSGRKAAMLLSPKGSLVFSPSQTIDMFLNTGFGYHSNDARSVVSAAAPGTPLARAIGHDLGVRMRILEFLDLAASLWLLDLESEIVWVGDEGVTEARGATRRLGVELEIRARLLEWLVADVDLTGARARFRDAPAGETSIPLAPRWTATAGLSVQHPRGLYGRLGMRSLSARPLTEDGFLTADGFTLVDLTLGYRTRRYDMMLVVDNALDANWREAQFATSSRLANEPDTAAPPPMSACPAGTRVELGDNGNFAGCEDVHFTPGAPINAMLTARVFF